MGKAQKNKIHKEVKRFYEKYHRKDRFIAGKTKVPYAGRVYDSKELIKAVDSVLDFWLTSGPLSTELENKFKGLFKAKDFLLVNSGSSANLLMIASLSARTFKRRLKPGDEVITPAVTFPTTVGPLVQYGLIPLFVDVSLESYNIREELIKKAIGKKTRAIFVPHTLGNPCNMDIIMAVAKKRDLLVIEDSCDALGSLYSGKLTGTFGSMASFSFYPAHHMTLGEGGGVVINDPELVRVANSVRDWGRECYCKTGQSNTCHKRFSMKIGDLPYGYDHKYVYSNIGYNLKITEMQSAIGLAQFDKLKGFIKKRNRNFDRYYKGLREFSEYLILPGASKNSTPSWFGFPITVKKGISRLKLIRFLENSRIETRLMFGGNITRQPAFKGIKYRVYDLLKNTDTVMNDTFFIGVYPGLTDEMIDFVLSRFKVFFKNKTLWK